MLHWPVRYKQYKRSARHAPPTPHINSNTRNRTLLAKKTRLKERVYIGNIRLRDSTTYRQMKFHAHPVGAWPPRQKLYLQFTDHEPNSNRDLHQGTTKVNVKVKITPEKEQRYSCTLSLTSTLDRGGWSTPRPGRFTPGKDPVPFV